MAWGAGSQGQLGDGYLDVASNHAILGSDAPVAVDGLSEATAISAGERFSLAIGMLAPLPTVTKLDPESGPANGGTSVRITGFNFTGVTAVRFGSTPPVLQSTQKPKSPRSPRPGLVWTTRRFPGPS